MLKTLIGDRIVFKKECSSWEEAIELGAASLLEQGYIKQEYTDQIIAQIKEFGPYIILSDGVAMPHTRPEHGAIKTGMSFLKLEQGILFPDTEIPVTLLFTLVAADNDAHLEAMMHLADLLGEEDILVLLQNVSTTEGLLKIIM
ncbi:MAG: PTS sugar transporter subunit IIA [Brevinema sp.]